MSIYDPVVSYDSHATRAARDLRQVAKDALALADAIDQAIKLDTGVPPEGSAHNIARDLETAASHLAVVRALSPIRAAALYNARKTTQ